MAGLLSDRIIGVESNGNATAKNPNSTATGAGQFIEGTWLHMVGRYRPDLAGMPRADVLALRNDPTLSRQMTAAYADENAAGLRSARLPVNDGTTYLAHFAGLGGAKSVLQSDPFDAARERAARSLDQRQSIPAQLERRAACRLVRRQDGFGRASHDDARRCARALGTVRVRRRRVVGRARSCRRDAVGGTAGGGDYLSQLLAAVTGPSSAQAASASAPTAAPAALPSPLPAEPQAPARFDARRFYALLQGRR